ncbi:MAG: hypothetical protein IKI46_09475 [Lachnospiraceae bacterium]|nr:hypothetical protein [Lachnospiraceae bacterium]
MEETVKKKRKFRWTELLFAALCAAFVTCGRSVYNYNTLVDIYYRPMEYGALFLFMFLPLIFVFALVGAGVRKSLQPVQKKENDEKSGTHKFFPVITSLLVIGAGLTALFSYFPGILGYDSEWQTLQAFGLMPLSNHHPVLHTLIWNFFIALEWFGVPHPYGLFIYCIVQILIVAGVCGYVTDAEVKAGCRWPVPVITMLYYALYPAFSVFSVEMTKDVLFSCVVVRLFLRFTAVGSYTTDSEAEDLKKKLSKKEKLNIFGIFFLTAIGCLLRNNFLPAAGAMVIVLFIMRKKNGMKKALLSVLAGVAIAACVMRIVYPHAGVEKTESHELLSVPVNQISSVYVSRYPELTTAERFIIDNYMEAGRYNPRLADSVKFTFNDALYDSDKSAFWDLYMHMFRKYPYEFADAFLTQNVQLWYPGARMTDRYAARKYIETENVYLPVYMITAGSQLPEMRGFYDMVFAEIEHSGVAGGLPFSLSIPFYSILLGFYIAIKAKRPGYTAGVFMSFFLWGTYLLGPVAAFRYMYPFFLLIPVILIPVFSRGTVLSEKAEAGASEDDSSREKTEEKSGDENSEKEKSEKKIEERSKDDSSGKEERSADKISEEKPEEKSADDGSEERKDEKSGEDNSEDKQEEKDRSVSEKAEVNSESGSGEKNVKAADEDKV